MQNHAKRLFSSLLAAVVMLGLTACGETEVPEPEEPEPPQTPIEIVVVDPDTVVQEFGDFHTKEQLAYLLSTYSEITQFASGLKELSLPNPITLTWEEETQPASYWVQLAMRDDFSDAVTYRTTETSLDVYNLYLATDYYWRAAASEADLETAEINRFTTTSVAPRNLYVDGITNVRDVGGWLTEDGTCVKQGMLYRGGRLNLSSADEFTLELTEQGRITFCEELGIKTEIDLRDAESNEIGSVADYVLEGVTYYNIPMEWSGNILTQNPEEIKEIFSILANPASYPVYFHCNIGTDRTGLIAFLCNALMGVSQEDLYRDYLFSNFGNIGSLRKLSLIETTYVKTISAVEGATFAEKTEAYLLGIGVTQAQIDSLRAILSD